MRAQTTPPRRAPKAGARQQILRIGATPDGGETASGFRRRYGRFAPMTLARGLLGAVLPILLGAAPPALAQAVTQAPNQIWPTRPVTLVVPFAAGGGTDVLGRIIGKRLSETLGQQVVIENVGGAGGMVGSARVAKSPPDGYQFVMGSRADAINQT